MKITVEDGDHKEVYQDVFSFYLAVTQMKPNEVKDRGLFGQIVTQSYSRGGDVREMVKELKQSVVELEAHLYGHSS